MVVLWLRSKSAAPCRAPPLVVAPAAGARFSAPCRAAALSPSFSKASATPHRLLTWKAVGDLHSLAMSCRDDCRLRLDDSSAAASAGTSEVNLKKGTAPTCDSCATVASATALVVTADLELGGIARGARRTGFLTVVGRAAEPLEMFSRLAERGAMGWRPGDGGAGEPLAATVALPCLTAPTLAAFAIADGLVAAWPEGLLALLLLALVVVGVRERPLAGLPVGVAAAARCRGTVGGRMPGELCNVRLGDSCRLWLELRLDRVLDRVLDRALDGEALRDELPLPAAAGDCVRLPECGCWP